MSYLNKDYLSLVETYFDINDRKTRKVVLNINEADQQSLVTSLTNKLYGFIVNKAKNVDFGQITQSKGDISKVEGYADMCKILDTVESLLGEFKQKPGKDNPVETVKKAIHNMESRKDAFKTSFVLKAEMGMLIYSTMAMAVISAVNIIVYNAIEFIKNPDDTFQMTIDKMAIAQTEKMMVIKNLQSFNKACEKDQFDKAIFFINNNADAGVVSEAGAFDTIKLIKATAKAATITGIVIYIIFNIMPFLRSLVYYFFYLKIKISDFFDSQADILTMNALAVEANTEIDASKRKQIVEKQIKIAQKLRNQANNFALKNKKSENEAENEIDNEDKKHKIDDVVDEIPDSALSLF